MPFMEAEMLPLVNLCVIHAVFFFWRSKMSSKEASE